MGKQIREGGGESKENRGVEEKLTPRGEGGRGGREKRENKGTGYRSSEVLFVNKTAVWILW